VSGGLPPTHPWAFRDIACATCKTALHSAVNENVAVWVETSACGYCVPDFATVAVVEDGKLPEILAVGKPPTLIERLQEEHVPIDTEHGTCCFQCSQTAADSEYRVMYPCPTLVRAYELENTAPTGA
jgi:hypothetical protein